MPLSRVPGEQVSPTQPFPTWPLAFDLQGRTEDHLIDYTPEIRRMALEVARDGDRFLPMFSPPAYLGDPEASGRSCPGGSGGVNITGAPVADPVARVIFISSHSSCGNLVVAPAIDSPLDSPDQTGVTHSAFSAFQGRARGGGPEPDIDGLSIWKGPVGRISAIYLNTGEYLWVIPNGDAPQEEQDAIRNHPLLQGVDNVMINRGRGGHAAMVATSTLLLASGRTADGTWKLFAIDKQTGERVGAVEIPGPTRYGMSSWVHEGKQYVIIQLADGLAALALP